MNVIRRCLPLAIVPLCMLAVALASTPWLRSFPSDVLAVPLYGAAVLSVLVPLVAIRLGARWLWLSALVDVICFVVYTLLVVLRDPGGVQELGSGLYHGPSQLLTFALPLVSPRSLMVAPVALCWLAGAIAGECAARRWLTMLPYAGFLVAFGLSYAATVRATGSDLGASQLHETIVAAALLLVLFVLRTVRSWIGQDEDAESTQADGILPLRGLGVGLLAALLVAGVAGAAAQLPAFDRSSTTPQRVPSVNDTRPVTPVAFIAGLRPPGQDKTGHEVFSVRTDGATPGYFAVANVDYYDGEGWTFQRTFRPSGGVLPADNDQSVQSPGSTVEQSYQITSGPLSAAPWMPYLYRPQKVTGVAVNIDTASGMIVPSSPLRAGASYTVRSNVATKTFTGLKASAAADAATPAVDTQLPATLRDTLGKLVSAFAKETGTPSSPAIPFLQALQHDLAAKYSLAGGPVNSSPRSGPTSGRTSSATRAGPSATPGTSVERAASTSFADVLASIVGPQRSGSPEQFATLVALVARQLGVPARVVTGFRVKPPSGKSVLPAGTYQVHTGDAWTWVEIPVVGRGWIVLDAAPGHYATGPRKQPSVGVTSSPRPTLTPTQNALITEGNAGHAVAKKSEVAGGPGSSSRALLIAIIIAVCALLLLVALLLALRKPLRARRRRREPDPRVRLVGAWQESVDMLTEAGLPELTNLTNTEIAAQTWEHFGPEPAARAHDLGNVANAAIYSTATRIDPAEADAAWQSQRALRKEIHRSLGTGGRLASGLRYHRSRRPEPPTGPTSWRDGVEGTGAGKQRRPRRHRRSH